MMHRSAHQVTFLYRTVHSWHHRLYVPYAFGALYNHPLEGFMLDTVGTAIAHEIAGLSIRQDVLFFTISTLKTVDDHCGFAFPWDPFQHLFGNNADYHDIHRALCIPTYRPHPAADISIYFPLLDQVAGLKKNYSQPWFISWECVLAQCLLHTVYTHVHSRSIFFNTRMTREEYKLKVAKRTQEGEIPPSEVNGPNELAATPTSKRHGIALKEKVN